MYLQYLEDNINHKFTKEMDEYKNYIKMFYNDRAKCPKDLKTILEKKQDDKIIELYILLFIYVNIFLSIL